MLIYDLSIFLTSTAFVDTNARYGRKTPRGVFMTRLSSPCINHNKQKGWLLPSFLFVVRETGLEQVYLSIVKHPIIRNYHNIQLYSTSFSFSQKVCNSWLKYSFTTFLQLLRSYYSIYGAVCQSPSHVINSPKTSK